MVLLPGLHSAMGRNVCSALELTKICTGFDWHRIKFRHNALCGMMFWICPETNVDQSLMCPI